MLKINVFSFHFISCYYISLDVCTWEKINSKRMQAISCIHAYNFWEILIEPLQNGINETTTQSYGLWLIRRERSFLFVALECEESWIFHGNNLIILIPIYVTVYPNIFQSGSWWQSWVGGGTSPSVWRRDASVCIKDKRGEVRVDRNNFTWRLCCRQNKQFQLPTRGPMACPNDGGFLWTFRSVLDSSLWIPYQLRLQKLG